MNFPTLFKITPEPFGLDLSDRSIKVTKLSLKKGRLFLENFGESDIEEGLMKDGIILSEEKLVSAIRHALSNLKMGPLKTPYVACSLPEQRTYLRVVQLPKIKKEEIQEAIQWEIEANFPIALSDVYFDWEIIRTTDNSPGGSFQPDHSRAELDHLDILVSAASRELVDSYAESLYKAGLKPFSFELESTASVRSLIKKGFCSKPVIIIDLGQTRTNFIIYAGYSIRFTSSIQISEDVIIENIMRAMNVNVEEAERLEREIGLNREADERVFESIVPAMTDLKQQIIEYMDFYESHSTHMHESNTSITKVILSGGGTRLGGIEKYLAVALKMPVEIANPWINILEPPLRETPELSYARSVRYATSLGLALTK